MPKKIDKDKPKWGSEYLISKSALHFTVYTQKSIYILKLFCLSLEKKQTTTIYIIEKPVILRSIRGHLLNTILSLVRFFVSAYRLQYQQ